jgi:predicted transcriptional regulator
MGYNELQWSADGRGSGDMVRGNGMTIRFSDEERQALDEAAKREDVPASIIIRRAVRREIERLKAEVKKGRRP